MTEKNKPSLPAASANPGTAVAPAALLAAGERRPFELLRRMARPAARLSEPVRAAGVAGMNSLSTGPMRRAIAESLLRRQRVSDLLFGALTRGAAGLIVLCMLALLFTLAHGSWPAFQTAGWEFFTRAEWDPVTNRYGALVAMYGTVVSSTLALVMAVPVAFGIAVFLTELSPRILRVPLGLAIELLAAVPSIIYGMWGLFVFAPFLGEKVEPRLTQWLGDWPWIGPLFQGPPLGIGMLTAALVLALMILPFITAVMRDVFETVPPLLKESAYGLGATTWEVVGRVIMPYTRAGVIGGVMLGLGRALGETMAVTFVIGNAHELSQSLFMPGSTISSVLANEFTEASGREYTSALIALALVLFLITFVVLAASRLLLMRLGRLEGKGGGR